MIYDCDYLHKNLKLTIQIVSDIHNAAFFFTREKLVVTKWSNYENLAGIGHLIISVSCAPVTKLLAKGFVPPLRHFS